MKRILSFLLSVLMLFVCGCAPTSEILPATTEPYESTAVSLEETEGVERVKDLRVSPSDQAYVRGGKYAWQGWRDLNQELGVEDSGGEALELKKGNGANQCVSCGACTKLCPQHIDIPTKLKEAHQVLI